MLTYILSFLLLRRFPLPRPLRVAFALFMLGLTIAVLLYTANLFLTLPERTGTHHVHPHATY